MINKALNPARRFKHLVVPKISSYLFGTSDASVDLIVIGAQKCGTTALYRYLSEHPDIEMPTTKELNYFTSIGTQQPSFETYRSLFPKRIGRNQQFSSVDISPSYLLDAPTAAKNIQHLFPSAKLVVVLREPVKRAISSWFMYKKYYQTQPNWYFEANWVANSTNRNLETTPRSSTFGNNFVADIEEEIKVLESGGRIEYPIVEFGHYKDQLKHYFSLFGSDEIKILESEELKNSTQACLNQITDWIGLNTHKLAAHQLVPHFVGDNKHAIPVDDLSQLTQYYERHNNGLEQLVGRKLSWTCAP